MNEYLAVTQTLSKLLNENKQLDECSTEHDSAFSQQICYGVLRDYYRLEYLVDSLLKKPLAEKHLDLHLLLMAGIYSIDHLNRPAHASVNAAVDSTIKLNKVWAKGLVNGVLRRYGREAESLNQKVLASPEAALNHPSWLIEAIQRSWPDHPEIFANNNTQAPMTLRVNKLIKSRDDYLKLLDEHDISATSSTLSPEGVILESAIDVLSIPGFSEGQVSVQDEAPQLAALLMNLLPGQRALDACAAPGGKTTHLLEQQPDLRLVALDRDRKRIGRITENLERLSLKAEIHSGDLLEFEDDELFDRILIDAPCSATGIIRRHPDIKLLRMKTDIAKLSGTQRVLLDKAFSLLKPDGELLYATCSILHEENDEVISAFLAQQQNAQLIELSERLPDDITQLMKTPYGLQCLPAEGGHDGFFYSGIKKVST